MTSELREKLSEAASGLSEEQRTALSAKASTEAGTLSARTKEAENEVEQSLESREQLSKSTTLQGTTVHLDITDA